MYMETIFTIRKIFNQEESYAVLTMKAAKVTGIKHLVLFFNNFAKKYY